VRQGGAGDFGGTEAGAQTFSEERRKRGTAEQVTPAFEEAAARLIAVEFLEETHGVQRVYLLRASSRFMI
jgi:hypothetical protein